MNTEVQKPDNGQDKIYTIYVNTREKQFPKHIITFREVVELAFENPVFSDDFTYTVTFKRGEGNKHTGTLSEGEETIVKEGMIFDVTKAIRS